jgi:hypothetical protein
MRPKREDGLHYFIISESEEEGYTGGDMWGKKSAIEQILKGNLYTTSKIRIRPHQYPEDGKWKQHGGQTWMGSFVNFISVEEVYDYYRYAGSMDFTIGSSERKKEPRKFLVTLSLDKHMLSRYKIEQHHLDYLVIESLHFNYYGTMQNSVNINAQLLHGKDRHGFSLNRLYHYSYDKHFKYYTLLCD